MHKMKVGAQIDIPKKNIKKYGRPGRAASLAPNLKKKSAPGPLWTIGFARKVQNSNMFKYDAREARHQIDPPGESATRAGHDI